MIKSNSNNSNEYVWICGTSGVGKETLIRKLAEESNEKLRALLGIHKQFQAFGPGLGEYTAETLSEIERGQVLIKWQFKTHKNIKRLIELRPDADHQAIVLWRPSDIQIQDLIGRGNCPKGDSSKTLDHDWNIVKRLFEKLRNETLLKIRYITAHGSLYDEMLDRSQ